MTHKPNIVLTFVGISFSLLCSKKKNQRKETIN